MVKCECKKIKENNDGTNGAPALYANIPIVNIKDEVRQTAQVEQKATSEEIKKEDKKTKQEEPKQNKKVKKEESEKNQKETKDKEQKEKAEN